VLYRTSNPQFPIHSLQRPKKVYAGSQAGLPCYQQGSCRGPAPELRVKMKNGAVNTQWSSRAGSATGRNSRNTFSIPIQSERLYIPPMPWKASIAKYVKVTKTKGAFTNDMALLKLVYLATKNIEKKWTSPLHNWSLTIQQLYIKFGNRLLLNTNSLGASPKGIETTDRV